MNTTDLAVCILPKLKWFTFSQNNSGGKFIVNNKVDTHVIIQAPDADTANVLAERIGIYFEGVRDGFDCGCCGDRWYAQWPDDVGTDEPEIYGRSVSYSPDSVLTSKTNMLMSNQVKVYPYSVISNM